MVFVVKMTILKTGLLFIALKQILFLAISGNNKSPERRREESGTIKLIQNVSKNFLFQHINKYKYQSFDKISNEKQENIFLKCVDSDRKLHL